MPDRIYKGPSIYGSSASTDTSNPGTGTGYRDTTITNAQIEAGLKKYDTLAASAIENEYLFRLSTLVDLIERTGVLVWNAETNYFAGAVVVANDNIIYQAVQPSTDVNPETDPGTTWVNYITFNSQSVSDATEGNKGIIEIATNAEAGAGNDDTKAITPEKLKNVLDMKILDATEAQKGIAKIATNAEALAGNNDTKIMTASKTKTVIDANAYNLPAAEELVRGGIKAWRTGTTLNISTN